MRFTLGITTKYIDRNLTASMTNNLPARCHPSNRWVLSCEQQITALNKVHNVNKANVLGQKNVVFSLVATAHLQPYRFLSLPQITRGMNPLSSINIPSWSH
jgi:hypothetical protein